jgi:hypothetical protein
MTNLCGGTSCDTINCGVSVEYLLCSLTGACVLEARSTTAACILLAVTWVEPYISVQSQEADQQHSAVILENIFCYTYTPSMTGPTHGWPGQANNLVHLSAEIRWTFSAQDSAGKFLRACPLIPDEFWRHSFMCGNLSLLAPYFWLFQWCVSAP